MISTIDPIHLAFDMVADMHTRVLVLGSLPGGKSLEARQYYAHPSNQFWRLMSSVVGTDLVSLAYADRLATLRKAGVGLWDVLASARRSGSLDTSIRDASIRDLKKQINLLPNLRALAFNGGKAFKHGVRQVGLDPGIEMIALPSSSSAYTVGTPFKQPHWNRLRTYLD
jgi:hypoxanthine-DNA glycosylase